MRVRSASGSIAAMYSKGPHSNAHVGDWLEVCDVHGDVARRGQIVEILGEPEHEHFQVRWNEDHESIVFPGESVRIVKSG